MTPLAAGSDAWMDGSVPSIPVDAATEPASPRSLQPVETVSSTLSGTTFAGASPSMADALDHASRRRMRAFHSFGIVAPLLGIALSFVLRGDVFARELFCTGMWLHALSNVYMLYLIRTRRSLESPLAAVLWGIAAVGLVPALYYFGPFSAVVMILLLGIVIVAIGRSGWIANGVFAFAIFAHVALAVPMTVDVLADVGLVSSRNIDRLQLAVMELLIVGFLVSGFAIGRWVRHTSADAMAELASARRLLGDQEQALVEINLHVASIDRPNEGRWTGHRLGRWKLGLVLGRGSMGEVYDAVTADGREAAVKVLAPLSDASSSLVERFHREMAVIAHLQSPHIVTVLDVSPPNAAVPYLAMERLHGFDLATRLRELNRLPLAEVVTMVDQIARGLEVARLAGVVHRDIKPKNVFCHDGNWKIFDFGIAKIVGSAGTLTGDAIVGTPHYMAPEQASDTNVSHLADVYALGAIAYRCLTGRAPFMGHDVAGLVFQVVHMPPQRPSLFGTIPRPVEDVLAVAMAKDPNRRFSSALDFVDKLIVAQRGGSVDLDVPPDAWLE